MGTLYLVATPIGNLEDITIRAVKTLFSVDYIACEDTRRTGLLLAQLQNRYTLIIRIIRVKGRKPKLLSYYDEIESKRIPEILNLLEEGRSIALVSDSGTPLISDPGFKLVSECIKRGIKIISIPGPTSIITALTLSGLPANQFLFLGYLPVKKHKRLKIMKELYFRVINPTIIFFESPHRLEETLSDLKEVFGDIEIVICRELTKIHEEIWRGKISEAVNSFIQVKGEIVILFSLNPRVQS